MKRQGEKVEKRKKNKASGGNLWKKDNSFWDFYKISYVCITLAAIAGFVMLGIKTFI